MYWKQNVVNFQFTLLMNQTKSCKICMNHFQSDTVTFNVHFRPSKVYLHLSFILCVHTVKLQGQSFVSFIQAQTF